MSDLIPDMPVFDLVGGPYDGSTAQRGDLIDGVHFLPESLIVKGTEGTATYAIELDEDGQTGRAIHVKGK